MPPSSHLLLALLCAACAPGKSVKAHHVETGHGDSGAESQVIDSVDSTKRDDSGKTDDSTLDPDADEDGYPVSVDCDDREPTVHPEAVEICGNGVDDDCNGIIDDPSTWYPDADGDGFGDRSAPVSTCARPDGTVDEGTDCDDANPAVNPGAVEVCDNGVDDDCDRDALECGWSSDHSLSEATAEISGLSPYGSAGQSVAIVGDINGDGLADFLVGAPAVETYAVCPGGVGLILGSASPTSATLPRTDAFLTGENDQDRAGSAVSGAGDVDGDGLADFIVGAPRVDDVERDMGAAYVVFGATSLADGSLGVAGVRLAGESIFDEAGETVSGAGDVDGDGFDDVLVGAPNSDAGGTWSGIVWLVRGGPTLASGSLADADARYFGATEFAHAGPISAAGDVDGDGFGDFLVGVPVDSESGSGTGAAYLILGGASPTGGTLPSTGLGFYGTTRLEYAGDAVGGGGDFNDDGYDDFLVGAPLYDVGVHFGGIVYLVLGGPGLAGGSLSLADARFDGPVDEARVGASVACAGDTNGDGFDDIALGTSHLSSYSELGVVYLVLGSATPESLLLSEATASFQGEEPGDETGASLSIGGDVNGDGLDDLLIGATARHRHGAACLFLGTGGL